MALTEGTYTAEFLESEAPGKLSRDVVPVTVGAGVTLPAGLVLGKITATSKYVAYNNGASDGSETAAGILYAPTKNSGGSGADFQCVIVNALAEVRGGDLNWNGQAQAAIDAGVVDFAAKFIKVRS